MATSQAAATSAATLANQAVRQRAQALFLPPEDSGDGARAGETEARDLLHIMPLSLVPLNTTGLHQARMIRNARMETRIELFADRESGSGQIELKDLEEVFPGELKNLEKDRPILTRLAGCASFDPYTLRRELVRMEIPVDDSEQLQLSPQMARQLAGYMSEFTRPLIRKIYGDDVVIDADVTDLRQLAQDESHRRHAAENLKEMAQALGTDLNGIPRVLEEYGETYLSLAYFQACLDEVEPVVDQFVTWMRDISQSRAFSEDKAAMKMADTVSRALQEITKSLRARFTVFDRQSQALWQHFDADNLKKAQDLISSQHATIGGVLCGLTLKMRDWRLDFPSQGGSPNKRMEFIKTEVRPGLDTIRDLERQGREKLRTG